MTMSLIIKDKDVNRFMPGHAEGGEDFFPLSTAPEGESNAL